jgi:hypothetical protein
MLHEPFCCRNFKYCETCKTVVEISDFDEHTKSHAKKEEVPILKPTNIINTNSNVDLKRVESAKSNCSFCELSLSLSELAYHEGMCGARTEICEYCNKKMLVKQLKPHLVNCTAKLALEQENLIEYDDHGRLKFM